MKLEDLIVQRFRVERIDDRMIVTADTDGNYLAPNAKVLERVLTTNCPIHQTDGLFVRAAKGKKWQPMIRRTLNRGYVDLARRLI